MARIAIYGSPSFREKQLHSYPVGLFLASVWLVLCANYMLKIKTKGWRAQIKTLLDNLSSLLYNRYIYQLGWQVTCQIPTIAMQYPNPQGVRR